MRKIAASLLLLLFVTGCSTFGPTGVDTSPQTPRQELLSYEFTYNAAVTTANNLVDQGVIVPGDDLAQEVGVLIMTARAALDAWHLVPDSTDKRTAAIIALTALQSTLTKLQQQLRQPTGPTAFVGAMS